jgi:toxin HigB-1
MRHHGFVIASFGDQTTQDIFDGANTAAARKIPRILWPTARRKLDLLSFARETKDLFAPPSNRLEKLHGDLAGFYSIRVNDQFRIIFRFANGNATDVRVTDYH